MRGLSTSELTTQTCEQSSGGAFRRKPGVARSHTRDVKRILCAREALKAFRSFRLQGVDLYQEMLSARSEDATVNLNRFSKLHMPPHLYTAHSGQVRTSLGTGLHAAVCAGFSRKDHSSFPDRALDISELGLESKDLLVPPPRKPEPLVIHHTHMHKADTTFDCAQNGIRIDGIG